jgi:hypothetical protein
MQLDWRGMSQVYSFLAIKQSVPPEHLVELVIMHLIDAIMLIGLNSNGKGLVDIDPTGHIQRPINLLIGGNIINDFNPLEVLIIGHGVLHKEPIRQILHKMMLNVQFPPYLLILFGGKQLTHTVVVVGIDGLDCLQRENVPADGGVVTEQVQQGRDAQERLPGGQGG